jgi:hypothetical protein
MRILSLCDYTGNMVRPWLEAGHEAVIVDLQHPAGVHTEGPLTRVGANILEYIPEGKFEAAFAFPPCTDLAVSGARHFEAKGPERRKAAMDLVYRCRDIAESLTECWFLENPVSVISTEWRPPDWTFHPYEYGGYLEPAGDRYTKATCLWTGPGFRMPMKRPVSPWEGSKMHRLPPSRDRQNLRSATPMGFARAVFEANATPPPPVR